MKKLYQLLLVLTPALVEMLRLDSTFVCLHNIQPLASLLLHLLYRPSFEQIMQELKRMKQKLAAVAGGSSSGGSSSSPPSSSLLLQQQLAGNGMPQIVPQLHT
jgi:hypothetical protein